MRYLIILFFIFLAGCSAYSRANLVRSYNIYPSRQILPTELSQRLYSNPNYYVIIDIRSPELFQQAHILNALNYPYPSSKNDLRQYLASLPENTPILLYDEKGKLSFALDRFILSQNRPIFFLTYGFQLWIDDIEGTHAEIKKTENKSRYDDYYL
ncbi:MAG: rhodanese-like domain-containing protein [Brevinema sp.]